jgi:hypothetical protein
MRLTVGLAARWGLAGTAALLLLVSAACNTKQNEAVMSYFQGSEADEALEQAIDQNDADLVARAIQRGANPNLRGLHGVTPLLMAVGKLKPRAAAELLRQGADTGERDAEGDNAVTLAVRAYQKNPDLLRLIIDGGGDPNTLLANGNPIAVSLLDDAQFGGFRYIVSAGADVNAYTRTHYPLLLKYAISEDWEAVWHLLELGARYHYPDANVTWRELFSAPNVQPPDSPSWPYKVKVWRFVKERGEPVPEDISELVGQDYWDYLEKTGLPRPRLEE